MPFEKGKPKTGGRKKGVMNRKTEHFFEICERLGHDPIEFNVLLAMNDWKALGYPSRSYTIITKSGESYDQEYITLGDRLTANNKLLDFMFPKRKAIELTNTEDSKMNPVFISYNPELLKEKKDSEDGQT